MVTEQHPHHKSKSALGAQPLLITLYSLLITKKHLRSLSPAEYYNALGFIDLILFLASSDKLLQFLNA